MSKKHQAKVKNHYSPVFANQQWTNSQANFHYDHYELCKFTNLVKRSSRGKGRKAFGAEKKLYSQSLENRLDTELENDSAILYRKLIDKEILSSDERLKWAQYIVTQLVRTPSFFKYRDFIEDYHNGDFSYKDRIIGCKNCTENKLISQRNWVILEAHNDDYFVRTDNPILQTGFLENPSTTCYYPLSPKLCFVACSMPSTSVPEQIFKNWVPSQKYIKLDKGDVFQINFELLRSASNEVILSKTDDGRTFNHMVTQLLGCFPQIPFMLSQADNDYSEQIETQKILNIMSIVDEIEYPEYREYTLKPFYGIEFE